jgi:hypothetical protein
MRWTAARHKNGGGDGDAAMSRNLGTPRLYDDSVIDDRNLRPLAIAFVTILTGWIVAFGLVFMSMEIGVHSPNLPGGSAAVVSSTVK